MNLYSLLFALGLRRLDPERAHELALEALRLAARWPRWVERLARPPRDERLALRRFGLRFPNPLGVAAGLDKNGIAVPALLALGFGHVEVGTVTPRPQPGNPRPRVFRLLEDRALINRMGFPCQGMEAVAPRLARLDPALGVVGLNVGKNRDTPLERAAEDYRAALARLGPLVDYAVVNVSSPNTPGLRALQQRARLDELCQALLEARPPGRHGRPLPLLLKLSPDVSDADLDEALDVALGRGLEGLVVANTTVQRPSLRSPLAGEEGGLSGAPLGPTVDRLLAACRIRAGQRLTLVAVGGVFDAEDVWRKLLAGASLVQVYTGFVYRGPALAGQILRGLERRLARFGVGCLEEVVGAGLRSP